MKYFEYARGKQTLIAFDLCNLKCAVATCITETSVGMAEIVDPQMLLSK